MAPPNPRLRKPGEPRPSLRERLDALRHVPALLRMVWGTSRALTASMIALRLVRSVVPILALWTGKLIIDAVVAAQRAGDATWESLWRLVALELGIVVGGEILARASVIVESLLGDLFANRISVRLMEHAATLDLAQFEDPDFYDHLERARRSTVGRLGLISQLLGILQDFITLLTLSGALLAFSPWLLLLLVVAVLPSFLGETHFASLGYSLLFRWTPERRQLDYLRLVGASDRTAKEVQMFGLAAWLTERYRALADRFYAENRRLALRRGLVSAVLSVVGTVGYYGAYAVVIWRTVQGAMSLGTLTFLAATFSRSRDLIQRLLLAASDIFEQALYLRDLFVFFEMKPTIASRPGAPAVPRPIREGFTFEDVGFRYPGSERWAVRHLSFTLRPGERVALVGENGAGKSTIVKLLARLYDPTEGRVLLDGLDLRDYDLASVRQAVGVIFQDFVRYDMPLDENIGVGQIDAVTDAFAARTGTTHGNGANTPARIVGAAEKSLASSLLPRLERGYGQMLGKRFEGGVDLSGGEWQKVALGRAYMRDAQLLILDEPTAALDARAEYEVFVRFSELMKDKMAIVISHRFSTVRMADRIIVLEGGKIIEQGSHEHLVARGGVYAELFELQASGYR